MTIQEALNVAAHSSQYGKPSLCNALDVLARTWNTSQHVLDVERSRNEWDGPRDADYREALAWNRAMDVVLTVLTQPAWSASNESLADGLVFAVMLARCRIKRAASGRQ